MSNDLLENKLRRILKEKNEKIIPENIKSGVTILGVKGDYSTGEYNTKMNTVITNYNNSLVKNITEIPLLDTSRVTSMGSIFAGCSSLTTIPLLDTSNVINMAFMFQTCSSLTTIPSLDTSNVTNMSNMFNGCTLLSTIPSLNTSKVTNMQNMFANCTSLSDESLNNILAMCTNSAITSNKKLKYIGLPSTKAAECQGLSNYQAFLDAGWTIGY